MRLTEKKKTCLRSQNSQSLSARNWHYTQVFLRSNHFFASSVRCTERDPLPLHSWPQSAFLLSPPSHTPASPPFSPSLIHVSSPLHHYREHKLNRMRAQFNQTICALTKLSLSLPLFFPFNLATGDKIWMLLKGLELGSDELSWRKKVKRGAGSTQQQRTEGGGDRWEEDQGRRVVL